MQILQLHVLFCPDDEQAISIPQCTARVTLQHFFAWICAEATSFWFRFSHIRIILQLHFPLWCWQQGSLIFSSSFWPVYLLIRGCFVSFYGFNSPIWPPEGPLAWIKISLSIPFPASFSNLFFPWQVSFPLDLAYCLSLTLTKSTVHNKKDVIGPFQRSQAGIFSLTGLSVKY